jgi:ATP-binding cassette, subfamily C, bacterial
MVFLRFLYRMLREQKLRLVFVTFLMACVALMEGLTVALLIPLMNVVTGAAPLVSGVFGNVGNIIQNVMSFFHINLTLVWALGLMVLVYVLQGLLRLVMWSFQAKMLNKYEISLINKLFLGYFDSSWSFFVHSRAGHLVNTLTFDTNRAVLAFLSTCDFLAGAFVALFYAVMSLLLSWQITLAGIVLTVLASLSLRRLMAKSQSYGTLTSAANKDLETYAYDKLSAAKLLKSSATSKIPLEELNKIAGRKIRARYQSWMNNVMVQSFYQPMIIAAMAIVVFVALKYIGTSLATILIFVYIFYRLTPYFSSVIQAYQQALNYIPSVLEIDRTLAATEAASEKKGGRVITTLEQGIKFEKVSFSYQNGTQVLKDASLEIKKNEAVAIIGESGIGKTTIVDLMLGLFTPDKGQILIDGTPLDAIDLAKWRTLVGYISQDVFLFHDTIEANLKWLVPDATHEQVEAAARASFAHEFIVNMPEGYKTVTGDRGVKLSGGQRQRLALARVMLQNAPIIIMDEATSALDTESEEKIRLALDQYTVNKTVLVISHRSTMLKHVNRIYAMAAGSLKEISKDALSADSPQGQ